jgi:Fe2+ or Zn2+ uptake regulation protein
MQSPAALVELFRARGLKITPQRGLVFEVLERNPGHLSAEAIWSEVRNVMPTVSLKTVYGILHELASVGEIQEVDLGMGSIRFDPNTTAHHHLVCDVCGSIQDLPSSLGAAEVAAAAGQGFEIASLQIIIRGTCAECRGARGRG